MAGDFTFTFICSRYSPGAYRCWDCTYFKCITSCCPNDSHFPGTIGSRAFQSFYMGLSLLEKGDQIRTSSSGQSCYTIFRSSRELHADLFCGITCSRMYCVRVFHSQMRVGCHTVFNSRCNRRTIIRKSTYSLRLFCNCNDSSVHRNRYILCPGLIFYIVIRSCSITTGFFCSGNHTGLSYTVRSRRKYPKHKKINVCKTGALYMLLYAHRCPDCPQVSANTGSILFFNYTSLFNICFHCAAPKACIDQFCFGRCCFSLIKRHNHFYQLCFINTAALQPEFQISSILFRSVI